MPIRRTLLAALLLASVVACSASRDETTATTATTPATIVDGEPVDGGVLRVGLLSDVDSYHPTAGSWTVDGHVVGSAIFEPLMAYDAEGQVVPWLAESVVPNEDLTRWTVTVRDGVTFHDGTPLDAEALERNVQAALFEGLISIAFEGTVTGVEVTGPRSVDILMSTPVAIVPEVLTGVAGYVAAPAFLDDPSTVDPTGTGPFRFVDRTPGSSVTVERNPDYWRTDDEGRPLPHLDGIEYQFILDDGSRYDALGADDLDLILTTSATDLQQARGDDALTLIEDLTAEETVVMLNAGAPPFDDPDARVALAYGTDPETLIDLTQSGEALPATSPFAHDSPWATDDGWVGFDQGRAAAAVEAYEATHGEPLSFRLSGLPTPDARRVLEELVSQWSRLGIEAEIDTLEPVAYVVDVTFGGYEAAWWRSFSYRDPLYLYPFFHSRFAHGPGELSTNFSQVRDDELDRLLEAYLAEPDHDERLALVEQIVPLVNEQQVNVWLFHTPYSLMARDVGGLGLTQSLGFASLEPKPWIGDLWLEGAAG